MVIVEPRRFGAERKLYHYCLFQPQAFPYQSCSLLTKIFQKPLPYVQGINPHALDEFFLAVVIIWLGVYTIAKSSLALFQCSLCFVLRSSLTMYFSVPHLPSQQHLQFPQVY